MNTRRWRGVHRNVTPGAFLVPFWANKKGPAPQGGTSLSDRAESDIAPPLRSRTKGHRSQNPNETQPISRRGDAVTMWRRCRTGERRNAVSQKAFLPTFFTKKVGGPPGLGGPAEGPWARPGAWVKARRRPGRTAALPLRLPSYAAGSCLVPSNFRK